MAGRCQAAFIASILTGLIAAATPAATQTVPLPVPAPQPRAGQAPPPPGSVQSVRPGEQPAPGAGGSSWLPSFLTGKPATTGTTTAFNGKQRALVDRVSGYLSSVHVLSGNFVQVGADGRRATGQFYIQKPGKVRFEYEPPSPIDIIADGSSVVVRDRRLATQDLFPLSQTPLRFLLSDKIDLLRETNVVAVTADELYVTVTIEEKHAITGTSRLMMMFGSKDMQLKQWVVTDPQGFDTSVAVSNLDSSRRPDPALFKIDYTDYGRDN
ncbi:MAG: outer-membrane lipoprotein carrier protein LolA [Xanthobacteraceae bacterium]